MNVVILKDPDAELAYKFDWGAEWLAVGDTIATSVWVLPAGIEQGVIEPSHTDTETIVWLKGGTAGEDYEVLNRITTAGGLKDDRSFTIRVKDR